MKIKLLKKLRKRAKKVIKVSASNNSYLISYKPYYSTSPGYFEYFYEDRFDCINYSYFKENEIREKIRLALIEIILEFVEEIKEKRKEKYARKLVKGMYKLKN